MKCPWCLGTGKSPVRVVGGKLALPKPEPRKKSKARKQKAHRESTSAIRRKVMERAGGYCEACLAPSGDLRLDHWLGGSGRRRQAQAVGNTWALCRSCDFGRTHNIPNAAEWNAINKAHCVRYGYAFYPHLEKTIGRTR